MGYTPSVPQSNFGLAFSGSALPVGAGPTRMTVLAKDVAWYQNSNKTFDLYSPTVPQTQNGNFTEQGGVANIFWLSYLVKPGIASVNPTTVAANGSTQVFQILLSKPLHPNQYGGSGGTLAGSNTIQTPSVSFSNKLSQSEPQITLTTFQPAPRNTAFRPVVRSTILGE